MRNIITVDTINNSNSLCSMDCDINSVRINFELENNATSDMKLKIDSTNYDSSSFEGKEIEFIITSSIYLASGTHTMKLVDTSDSSDISNTLSLVIPSGLTDAYKLYLTNSGDTFTMNKVSECSKVGLEAYPIGSVYISSNSTSPAELFGGTWSPVCEGRTLLGVGSPKNNGDGAFGALNNNGYYFYENSRGGQYNHYLTINEMPSHGHSISYPSGIADVRIHSSSIAGSASLTIGGMGGETYPIPGANNNGGGGWHSNMSPYEAKYMWERIS